MRRALRILELVFVLVCVIGLFFAVLAASGTGTDGSISSTYAGSYPNCPDSNGYPGQTGYPGYPGVCDMFLPVVIGD